jgi:hypothetical protein
MVWQIQDNPRHPASVHFVFFYTPRIVQGAGFEYFKA